MGTFPKLLAVILVLVGLVPACFAVRHADYAAFARPGEVVPGVQDHRPTEEELERDEAGLAKEARLEPILRLAMAHSPDIAESTARLHSSTELVGAAGHLPDLELKYEQWGVPLARPWALDQSDTLMLGVRQAFPAFGNLDAQSQAAAEDSEIQFANLRTRQLDIAQQVRRAYYQYDFAFVEYQIHVEHAAIAERLVELGRANFRAGKGTQQDVLKMGVELTRLHSDLAAIEQRKRSTAALLNSLMARDPDAPLGPPAELQAQEIKPTLADLEQAAGTNRPEIAAAEHTVGRTNAQLHATERTANWPSFMVGIDYWFMPTGEKTHAYGAMVSMNLPWINSQHREQARAQEYEVTANKRTVDSVRITVRFQVRDAYARYQAALETFRIIDQDLLSQARQSFEAAQATYATGGGDALGLLDALRSLLEVRLDRARALVELDVSIGDLERAVGAEVDRQPLTKGNQP